MGGRVRKPIILAYLLAKSRKRPDLQAAEARYHRRTDDRKLLSRDASVADNRGTGKKLKDMRMIASPGLVRVRYLHLPYSERISHLTNVLMKRTSGENKCSLKTISRLLPRSASIISVYSSILLICEPPARWVDEQAIVKCHLETIFNLTTPSDAASCGLCIYRLVFYL